MKKYFSLLFFLFELTNINGQISQAAYWYFGYEAGIEFTTGAPIADTNSHMISIEGSCSISDTLGNLLMYSDGESVWSRNHIIMPNGNGILGDQSSTQSSLLVPRPKTSLFYLFTTDGATNNGTRYSVIDMNLNGGLGDVTALKNVVLFNAGTEELAGTMHCDRDGYWIVTRQNITGSLKFYAYLLTSSGLNYPVITTFDLPNPPGNTVSHLTFSQDGQTLCFTSCMASTYIFDFDLSTGYLSIRDSIPYQVNENMYSNALSPDGTKLYTTSWKIFGYSKLSQFDLSAPDIPASRVDLDSVDYTSGSPNGYGFIGQVRLAPDQKIYVSRWNQEHPLMVNPNTAYSLDSLDVIHDPNLAGLSCNFQRNYIYLDHKPTQLGLPNFISNFTSPQPPAITCFMDLETYPGMKIQAYPNPFTTHLILQPENAFEDATMILFDLSGKVIKQVEHISGNEFTLDREGLADGLYFLKVFQAGRTGLVKKIEILPN